jgi:hypothetical protein
LRAAAEREIVSRIYTMGFDDLRSDEVELVGQWIQRQGHVGGDQACERIEWLVAHCLERVATDTSGWETLFRDHNDGRFWERTYPRGEMHGGGPPTLRLLAPAIAARKYGVS